jgi:uncharacterized protein
MSAPAVIDSIEFARSEQALAGELPVAGFERLQDVLTDSKGALSYTLRGGKDERQRPFLVLRIEGDLRVQCQRCLQPFDYPVEVRSTLLLIPRGEQADELFDDPSAPDAIEPSAELDVAELIEDELLLSLPLSPRHPEGTCTSRTRGDENTDGAPSAFAQLATQRGASDNT